MSFLNKNVEKAVHGLFLSTDAKEADIKKHLHNFVDDFNGSLTRAYVHGKQRECCATTLWALQKLLLQPDIHPDMTEKIGEVCWNLQMFLYGAIPMAEA